VATRGAVSLHDNQTSIREAIDAGLLAGAVTIVWQSGRVLQVNELGYRDIAAQLPMQRDTLFRIASMSKPVTVAAMALVEEGRLALTDPVTKWVPELADLRVLLDPSGPLERTEPARRLITIEDLMTHRSGLAYARYATTETSSKQPRQGFGVSGEQCRADRHPAQLLTPPRPPRKFSPGHHHAGPTTSRLTGYDSGMFRARQ
jgi:CubicO group peptidase (beta-lactamase class C family)